MIFHASWWHRMSPHPLCRPLATCKWCIPRVNGLSRSTRQNTLPPLPLLDFIFCGNCLFLYVNTKLKIGFTASLLPKKSLLFIFKSLEDIIPFCRAIFKSLEDIIPFCRATDTPDLDFGSCLPWVQSLDGFQCLYVLSPVYNRFLRFTPGVTPVELLVFSMAVKQFISTYLCSCIGRVWVQDRACHYLTTRDKTDDLKTEQSLLRRVLFFNNG